MIIYIYVYIFIHMHTHTRAKICAIRKPGTVFAAAVMSETARAVTAPGNGPSVHVIM